MRFLYITEVTKFIEGKGKSMFIFSKLNQLVMLCFNLEVLLMIGLACIILTMTIFIVGLIIDYKKKDAYFVKKIYYRTVQNEIGRGEEYYFRYWVWQRYKKKYLRQILENELDITRVYSGKARKKKKYQKTRIPFLREVYGVAK